MDYQQLYYRARALMKNGGGVDQVLGITLHKHAFTSAGARILPGKDRYYCPQHACYFGELPQAASDPEYELHPLKMQDIRIRENKYFAGASGLPDAWT